MQSFDAIVIGTGQAGPALAVDLANSGKQVAIVERKDFGGTCVNTGCIPTKTLVASAYAAHIAKHAEDYGVTISCDVTVDMKKVKARKDAIAGGSSEGVESWLRNTKNLTVIKGHAQFESPNTIRVNEDVIKADRIFIDVGARAFVPPLPGLDQVEYLNNSSIMHIDFLPEHLLIIGGSYIGLEFAQMYRRFGSKVTVIERNARLISREDEDISYATQEILENEGIKIKCKAECMSVCKAGDKIRLSLDCEEGSREVEGSHLLIAVGRKPNTDDLGLDKAGVNTNEKGYVVVDDELKTNVAGIWAMGECNGQGAFTHTAYNDYEIVRDNLLHQGSRKISDRILTYGLFIDPPLARVGMTENEVRESGRKALIATRPMSRVGRAREKGETQGFMKILVDDKSKEILGMAILGMSGDEAIHCVTDLMYAKAPYTVITHAVHIRPIVAKLIPAVIGDVNGS